MVIGVLLVLLGGGCIGASALAWTGRWRSWSRRVLTGPLPYPLVMLPALGLILVATGLHELGVLDGASPLGASVLLILIAGFALYLWSPAWLAPGWLKEQRADDDDEFRPDLSDPLTALSYAAVGPGTASSAEAARARMGGSEPVASWNATWVQHDQGGPKPHGLGRAGAVSGKLELHHAGVVFRALGLEDRLRDEETVVLVERRALRATRVVARGAGPDGRRRPGHGPRSAFARLVLDTDDGPLLFEVNGAKGKARRIAELLGPAEALPR